jgi:hypothetical protein
MHVTKSWFYYLILKLVTSIQDNKSNDISKKMAHIISIWNKNVEYRLV